MLSSTLFALSALTAPAHAGGETHWLDNPILAVEAANLDLSDEPLLLLEPTASWSTSYIGYSHTSLISEYSTDVRLSLISDAETTRQRSTRFCRDGQYDMAPPVVISVDISDPPDLSEALVGLDTFEIQDLMSVVAGLDFGKASFSQIDEVWEDSAPLLALAVDPDSDAYRAPLIAIATEGEVDTYTPKELYNLDLSFVSVELVSGSSTGGRRF